MIKKKAKIIRTIDLKMIIAASTSLLFAIIAFFMERDVLSSVVTFVVTLGLVYGYFFGAKILKKSAEIKKMENAFPDFIELMASNLRAGMTTDRSLLLSSRKEFAPLDEEILKLGKEVVTGKDINEALEAMAKRIDSEKIRKTINLIMSGIKSGGNLAILLEETAISMKERSFVEKKAASNVLMYIIFIFFAAGVGAPALFSLSNILVGVLTQLMSNIPVADTSTQALPLTLTKITISTTFVNYFSIFFIIITDVLASMIIGLVNKGNEKEGIKYAIPLIILSIVIFFVIKIALSGYFADLIK